MANEFKIKNGLLIEASTNSQPIIAVRNASSEITIDASSLLVTAKAIHDYTYSRTYIDGSLKITTADSSFYTTKDWFEDTQMAGRISGGVRSENLDGTVDVSAGFGIIHTGSTTPESYADDPGLTSPMKYISWPDTLNVALTDNAYNYIYWDYETQSILATTNFYSIDYTREFTIGRAYRTGNKVIARLCGTNVWNFDRRVQLFGEEVFPVKRANGLIMSDATNRQFSATGGILWAELVNRFTIQPKLAATNFSYWRRNGLGGYIDVSANQINNTQYDNNAGTLTNFGGGPNKWRTDWVYVVHDSTYHVVVGQQESGSLTAAEAVPIPVGIPGFITAYGTFVGRIIIQKNTDTLYITSAFATTLGFSGVTSHNDLGAIQGGTIGEYYHLTSAELADMAGKTYVDASFVPNASVGTAASNTVYYEDGFLEASLGFLDWKEIDVSYNTPTIIYNMNDILTSSVTSNYIEVTSLYGVQYDTPGKKVSLGAMRISELMIHTDYSGGIHSAEVKTQHSGIYAKYFDDWTNVPEMHDVKPEQIKVYMENQYIYIKHTFGIDELIEPTLKCKYIMKIKQLELQIT